MEIVLVLAILLAAVALFATEKLPVDEVALLVLAACLLFGLVTPAEGLSGLSNPATVTVAAMFVLSAGLQKTGAVTALGSLLVRLGGSQPLLLALIIGGMGLASAFINNTAALEIIVVLVVLPWLWPLRTLSP
jgi:di/tricarboxylate transporter